MSNKIEKAFINLYVAGEDLKKIQNDFVQIVTDNIARNEAFVAMKAMYPRRIIDSIVSLSNRDF